MDILQNFSNLTYIYIDQIEDERILEGFVQFDGVIFQNILQQSKTKIVYRPTGEQLHVGSIGVSLQVHVSNTCCVYVRHLPEDCLYHSSWRRCTQSTRRYRRQ